MNGKADSMTSGYEQIYLDLLPALQSCDLRESAGRLGLSYAGGRIRISFFGREYIITNDGAEPMDGRPVNVNSRSVLLHYVMSRASVEPEYSFVPLSRLAGVLDGHHPITDGIMNASLVRCFGNDLSKLKAAINAIDGVYEGTSNSGGHTWLLHPLPKIPVRIIFYEADEEFPPEIQIMPDKTAPRIMDFECLAFFCGCMVNALTQFSV
jgi:hypothetical protein